MEYLVRTIESVRVESERLTEGRCAYTYDERQRNLECFKSMLNEAGTLLPLTEVELHKKLNSLINNVQEEICSEDNIARERI